ncbi:acyltransferase [uncultured Alsobacter sp.]|uniref:acyltransferase family protein n=1 Tax=uncultured Alsobacter sp. TaxID=1748258 RepID=UPI0025FF39B3|nr:acyltransferase [uncultured Alsobacter sp.]
MSRLRHIDGLRAIATALVVLFHGYSRWPEYFPYGDKYVGLPVLSSGKPGVELFFMISGFVILMTLEKCTSFSIFIGKRWLRLFPAILICSAIIYVTGPLLWHRPAGTPTAASLVPGLLLIDPYWLHVVTRLRWPLAEGAMWSLFVEVQFYFVFGIGYFVLGSVRVAVLTFALFVASHAVSLANAAFSSNPGRIGDLVTVLGTEYYGWFAVGACMYLFWKHGQHRYLIMALIAGAASSLVLSGEEAVLVGLSMTALFVGAVTSAPLQAVIGRGILPALGLITYPVYLLHENMMVSLIIQEREAGLPLSDALLPLPPIALILGLSWMIARVVEPRLRKAIARLAGMRDAHRALGTKPGLLPSHRG